MAGANLQADRMTPEQELEQYVGLPKCQDCGWKLGTAITDNCPCHFNASPDCLRKYESALARARELQNELDLKK